MIITNIPTPDIEQKYFLGFYCRGFTNKLHLVTDQSYNYKKKYVFRCIPLAEVLQNTWNFLQEAKFYTVRFGKWFRFCFLSVK